MVRAAKTKSVKITEKAVLDPVYCTPEFNKAADALIEAVRHRYCVVDGHIYDREVIVAIAEKVLENR